jgi:hypothetical protein
LWVQIGEELKKSDKFQCSFIAHIGVEWNSSKTISCSKIPEWNVMERVSKFIDIIISMKYFSKKEYINYANT